jgi:hypothetical protein
MAKFQDQSRRSEAVIKKMVYRKENKFQGIQGQSVNAHNAITMDGIQSR